MTISNKKVLKIFKTLLVLSLLCLFFDFVLNAIQGSISDYFDSHWMRYVGLFMLISMLIVNYNYFSIEFDHEIIHIKSWPFMFGKFMSVADINSEFPKRNLKSVEWEKKFFSKKLKVNLETLQGDKSYKIFKVNFIKQSDFQKVISELEALAANN